MPLLNSDKSTRIDILLNKPNKETVAAMLEAERIAKDPSVKGYTDLNQLFADLKK
jgi:DNA-damage-inducible protein J